MDISYLVFSLILTMTLVALAMRYLRNATRKVLLNLCEGDGIGADFWLRSSDVLAMSGSLMLVLLFGRAGADWGENLRLTLVLTLAGIFLAVLFVASSIGRRSGRAHPAATVVPKAF
jgi:hypothetical protein